jgi:hypothetical protein
MITTFGQQKMKRLVTTCLHSDAKTNIQAGQMALNNPSMYLRRPLLIHTRNNHLDLVT